MRRPPYLAVLAFAMAFVAITGLVAPVLAADRPTTRPVLAPTWPEATARLARALTGKDITEAATVLAGADRVSRFGSDAFEMPDRVLASTTGMTTLGVHAYGQTPGTLASDLAGDFRDNDAIPSNIRRQMIPPDDAAARRADVTAAQWLAQVLKIDKEQERPVAVVVLWPDTRRRNTGDLQTLPPRPTFILVKGESTGEGFRISHLVYGDPLQG